MGRSLRAAGRGLGAPPPEVGLREAVEGAASHLRARRLSDGHWTGLHECGLVATLCCALLKQRCGRLSEAQQQAVVRLVQGRRRPDGTWPIWPDGPADPDGTLLAYIGLRLLGCSAEAPPMQATRRWLLREDVVRRADYLTRAVVQLLDPSICVPQRRLPLFAALLPDGAPPSVGRIMPRMATLYDALLLVQRFPTRLPPDLRAPARAVAAELGLESRPEAGPARQPLPRWARRLCARILSRQEATGDWGGWSLETAAALGALWSAGLPDAHPAVARGLDALDRFDRWTPDGPLTSMCTSGVWDTAWALVALDGLPLAGRDASLRWLLERRIGISRRFEGWPFEESNRRFPDVDDTAMAIGVLGAAPSPPRGAAGRGLRRALAWLFDEQNWHGGWPSFRKHAVPLGPLLRRFGLPDIDHGNEDVTARVLWALGRQDPRAPGVRRAIRRGARFLLARQRRDGSWLGWWTAHYLYGAASALWGLRSAGYPAGDWTERAIAFIVSHQHADGGWGESCESARRGGFVDLPLSTPSQTAWCLIGLSAWLPPEHAAIRDGVQFLTKAQRASGGWHDGYPVSAALIDRHYYEHDLHATSLSLIALRCAGEAAYRRAFCGLPSE